MNSLWWDLFQLDDDDAEQIENHLKHSVTLHVLQLHLQGTAETNKQEAVCARMQTMHHGRVLLDICALALEK